MNVHIYEYIEHHRDVAIKDAASCLLLDSLPRADFIRLHLSKIGCSIEM